MSRAREWSLLLALSAGSAALSCVPTDLLGEEELVAEHDESASPPALEDDNIADKHPVYDESLTIDETFGSCRARLNKSASVTSLDVVPPDQASAVVADGEKLYSGYVAAAAAFPGQPVLPTMELVNASLKPFDDGLYAAVELGAESAASGSLVDKRRLLDDVLATMLARVSGGSAAEQPLAREAAARFAGAITLAGGKPAAPADVLARASVLVAGFDATPLAGTPIGFYTWNGALSAIFRQDRFLQAKDVSFGAFAATASALDGAPDVAKRYGAVLDLYAGLTDPSFGRSPRDVMSLVTSPSALDDLTSLESAFHTTFPETVGEPNCAAGIALFPASDDASNRVFRQLSCAGSIPAGTNLIDLLIAKIRSGAIDLTPTSKSGWDDRQIYALETLLLPDRAPEKDHLFLTKRYKQKLVETFKTLLVETRETHVKQLDTPSFGGSSVSAKLDPIPFDVYPQLPVEPFPTFYLRTARAYRFVQTLLEGVMGPTFLTTAHRLREDGSNATATLSVELDDHVCRLYGLHAIAAASIGMAPQISAGELGGISLDHCMQLARTWVSDYASDLDTQRDPRVIVPVAIDVDKHQIRYWAMVGVRAIQVRAKFYEGHEPTVLSATTPCVFRSFVDRTSVAFVGKTLELALPADRPPPTRAEFRAICDRAKNADEVLSLLGAAP